MNKKWFSKGDWIVNLKLALLDMVTWKNEFIERERAKNPQISFEELSSRIRKASAKKYRNKYDFLVFEHPEKPYHEQRRKEE